MIFETHTFNYLIISSKHGEVYSEIQWKEKRQARRREEETVQSLPFCLNVKADTVSRTQTHFKQSKLGIFIIFFSSLELSGSRVAFKLIIDEVSLQRISGISLL